MIRHVLVLATLSLAGCSRGTSEPASNGNALTTPSASAETFAGVWRSTTPSLEFVRLSVSSKSSQQDVLAARLTFSGVAWEGDGRIDADSLVANMGLDAATPARVIVARVGTDRTLRLLLRAPNGEAKDLSLTFVRD